MCGDRRVVEGPKVADLYAIEDAGNGKEIDEVPLCARCVAEIKTEQMDDEHLIPMALGRVEKFDGGLSRRRWETRQLGPEPVPVPIVPIVPSSSSFRQPPALGYDYNDGYQPRPPSPIYVSIRDPIGQPTFRRSPTKPIPKWMQYLPSHRPDSRDCPQPRPASIFDPYLSHSGSKAIESDDEDQRPPAVPPHTTPVKRYSPPLTYTPVQMSRPFTFIAEEPVQRPSSTKARAAHYAQHSKHVRFTPGQPGPQTYSINDKAKASRESSEYLERYKVSSMGAAKPMPTVLEVPKVAESRYVGPRARERSAGESSASSARSQVRHLCPQDEDRAYSTALGVAARYGISSSRKEHSSHEEHVRPPADDLEGAGGDGVADGGSDSRRAGTFQDQLKRVFGFS